MVITTTHTSQDSDSMMVATHNPSTFIVTSELMVLILILLVASSYVFHKHYRRARLRQHTLVLERLWKLDAISIHKRPFSN